ncbi:MAG: PDZ domain-containing protein [Acidimicrobiia bacterium]
MGALYAACTPPARPTRLGVEGTRRDHRFHGCVLHVTAVHPGSFAALAGIEVGDLLLTINHGRISSPAMLQALELIVALDFVVYRGQRVMGSRLEVPGLLRGGAPATPLWSRTGNSSRFVTFEADESH